MRAIAERWRLPADATVRFEELTFLLAEDPAAPTAVKDPLEIADVHIADSLSALQVSSLAERRRMVDIGSGAGLPGLALAIALPAARFDLVEASKRKCEFLARAIQRLELENARPLRARVEEVGAREGMQAYDCALARAVGPLATLIEYGAPLLRVGGLLIAWKGRRDRDEERQAEEAAAVVGARLVSVERAEPFEHARDHHLYVYEQVSPSPQGYPRRPGVARKRPLGTKRPARR